MGWTFSGTERPVETNDAAAWGGEVSSHCIYISAGGKEFELTETFVPEVDEVVGRRFGESLAEALRRYGERGVPVLIKKIGKSCLLYTQCEGNEG